MRNFTFRAVYLFKLISFVLLLFVTTQTRAQFPFSQSFKYNTAPGIQFGGSPIAFLTGGAGTKNGYTDANGSGYLRLTNNLGNQKGIIYSDLYAFPSAYGMTISFEYYTHGTTSDSGADGIAFILFDAAVASATPGAFGGSLGYAQRDQEEGFSKGYLGIGIDEYGNFSAANEGKVGGAGVLPSNITLRGKGTGLTGYDYLTSVRTTTLASPFNVAGNLRSATDNTKPEFRKIEIVLKPRTGGGFFIDVNLTHGNITDKVINNYVYTVASPSNLKFAISSSTGGSNNFHEIRNLNITVDPNTLLTPVANADSFKGCMGTPATSDDITANDNGTVNTLGTLNKASVDLDPAVSGIQTTKTVSGQGTFTYDATTGKVTFTPVDATIAGPVSINYTFNDYYGKTSNTSTITYTTYAAITNNTISPATTVICTNGATTVSISGSVATDGASTMSYQWYSSSDNANFSLISGANNQNYTTPRINSTTYYRRVALTANCSSASATAAVIFGYPDIPIATAATSISCSGFTANWNNVSNAQSYKLYLSKNSSFSSFESGFNGLSVTGTSYAVSGLTANTTYFYKITAVNTCGESSIVSSNSITALVGTGSVAGTVSSAQTICSGSAPGNLTLSGYTGTIQWQSSPDNTAFNDISGATSATLTSTQMGVLTANTYYRAVVKSGSCTPANTNPILVSINPVPKLTNAVQAATVCSGSTATINLTGLLNNSTSTIAYSIDGVSQPPITVVADASGNGSFDITLLAANNNKILKITGITTTSSTPNCTATFNKDITLSVTSPSVGGSVSGTQAICSGTSPTTDLVLSGNLGSVDKWQKASDAAFTNPTDITSNSITLTGAIIGNLSANTYFRAVVKNGICSAEFSSSALITINANPTVPTITTTAATCSTDASSVVSNYTSGITYIFNPTGPIVSTTGAISNMVIGTNYTVTATNTSNCTSGSSVSFKNVVKLVTPAVPTITTTPATCSADASSVVSNYASGITYTFSPLGPTVSTTGAISNMVIGTNYMVTAKNTNCTSGSSVAFSNAAKLITPAVPTITTSPATCSVDASSVVSNYASGITYTFSPLGPTVSTTGVISNMVVGTSYTVTATNTSNCTSGSSATFSNAAKLITPAVPAITTNPATCSADASSVVSNYASGITYTFSPLGPTVSTTGAISNMVIGTNYTVTATNTSNCTSGSSATFSNAAKLVTPAVPTITTNPATCSADASSLVSNYASGITYTFSPLGPIVSTTGAISNMVIGTSYTVTATNTSNCTSGSSATFSNAAKLLTPAVPTITTNPATCSADASSVVSNYASGITYTFSPLGPIVSTTGAISNMVIGTNYTATATNTSNCASVSSATFSNAAKLITPAVPTITTSLATCSADASSVVSNYASGITYTFSPLGPTVSTTGVISNMVVGTSYTVTATNTSNCTSASSVAFSNAAKLITPAVPTITTNPATCSADASSVVSNYASGITYTFDPIGPIVSTTGAISNMVIGTNYTVTAGNTNCTSVSSATFSNAAKLITPAVPTITTNPATCSADASSVVSNYTSGITYTFDPIGPSVDTSGAITGMVISTSYTATATNTSNCTSGSSATFSNAAKLITPAVPTITTNPATCSADASSVVSNYTSGITYTFSPLGPTVSTTGAISNMVIGTNYTVTATNTSNCTSGSSATFSNAAKLVTPAVPTITTNPATCSADASSVVSNYASGITYTFSPLGPIVSTTGAISNMVVGTSYTVTATNTSNCTSASSATFSNAAKLLTPAVPAITTNPATCSADASSVVSNYASGITYTFSPLGPIVSTTGVISNMVIGTSYTVTATNTSNCTSASSATFSNAAKLVTPAVPAITTNPATCSADASSVVSNYTSGITYTFDPIGPSVDTSGVITGMIIGTDYTVTAGNINCTSGSSATFSNAAKLITPAVPTITTSPATCSADASSLVSNYASGITYTFDPIGPSVDTSGAITGMVIGTSYTATATNTSNCTSGSSATFSNAAKLITPAVPTITTNSATCTVDASSVISNYASGITYTFDPIGPNVDTSGAITGMVIGTSYTAIATNTSNCTSGSSATFSNAAKLLTPAVPTITTNPATCSAAASSIVSNYASGITYTFDPIGPSVDTSGAITGMVVGTSYTVTATNTSNCTSASSATFSNAAKLITPAVPAITTNPATCSADASSVVSNYASGITYTFDPLGPIVSTTGAISNMVIGTNYTVTAGNTNCTSVSSATFSNAAKLLTPAVPTITTNPATCSEDASSVVSNYASGITYTFDPIGPSVDTSGVITGMIIGTDYTVTAGNINCTSGSSVAFSNAAKLLTPAVPTITTNPATCSADASSVVSNYASGITYTFSPLGPIVSTTGAITGMIIGTSYTATATNTSNCTSASSATFSNAAKLITPAVPTITTNPATCSADASSVVSNYASGITYTFDPIGPNVDTSGAITGMVIGTSYTAIATNTSNCTSGSSATFSNAAKLITPAVPTITTSPATCSADASSVVSNYASGITYTFDPIGPSVDTSGAITGMIIGTSYTVTATNTSNCTSASSATFSNAAKLITPAVPYIISNQATCSTAGNLSVTNYDPALSYTFNPSGPTITSTGVINGITVGVNYNLSVINAGNCSSASSNFSIDSKLCAQDDNSFPSQASGTTAINVGNVTSNDTLNGIMVTATNTIVTAVAAGPMSIDSDGKLTLAPNTQSGTYTIDYTICEQGAVPANCKTATATVEVKNILVANPDSTFTAQLSDTTAITTVGNVTSNDTLNGMPVTLVNTSVTPIIAGPLRIDANGILTLDPNTSAGSYNITYELCEKNANPANCTNAIATVIVTAPVIDAVKETTSPINGTIGGTTASLTLNDTLNGNAVVVGTNPGEVLLSGVNVPSGLTLNPSGTVSIAAGTPAGIYTVEYKICEVNNATNCDSVISEVVVTGGVLQANVDTIGSVVGINQPVTLVNVFANDTNNGLPVVASDMNLTVLAADPTGYIILNSDGTALLGANAPAGTYELIYQICEKLNPTNCSSASIKVIVTAPVIDAVKETTSPINGTIGGTTASLTLNDTLNGNAVVVGTNPGEVLLSGVNVPSGLTLNPNGTVSVAAGTPAGIYTVEYKICEVNNATNCDSVISEVVVTGGVLQANVDTIGSVVGINQPVALVNVFANDTNNGLPVVASDMNLTVLAADPTGYIILNSDGTALLGANVPAGTYELIYQICEKLNPTNCSSASINVTVTAPTMTVTANSYCSNDVPYVSYTVTANNFTPNNLLTIKWIDSANKVVATQTNLPLTGNVLWPGAIVDSNQNGIDWPGWLLNNGQWIEGADGFENTRTGVTMQFSVNPTVNVVVNYPPATPQCNARPTFAIKANNDTAGPIDSDKGQSTTINIFNNDTLNGVVVDPSNVVLSTVVSNPNLDLKSDGSIEIKTGTPTGSYQLTYQICDASNLSNCSQAIVKVTVLNITDPAPPTPTQYAQIILTNDVSRSVDGINGEIEFINVLNNDLLNALPIDPANIVIANTPKSPYFEFNTDGTVSVRPNTPGGNYALTYQVCEKINPTNCYTATLNVFVEVPAIAIIKTAVFNDENGNGFANAGETITYKFKVTNMGNVPLTRIAIADHLPGIVLSGQAIDLDVNESDENNFAAHYKITQEDINLGSVSNQASVQGRSGKGILVEDKSDDSSNIEDKPTVLPLNGCQIKVLNAFSPNGDSKNSRFYIQGLECYPDNTVEIYNRWGVLVFDIDHYNNEDRAFIGISAGRTTIKQTDGLPVGTYFYILKYKDSDSKPHELSGYVYINK